MSYARAARSFPQKATYWAKLKNDGYGGESWTAPVVVSCRWDDATAEELSVAYKVSGETVTSNAKVLTPSALLVGGYLRLGETTEANPARLTNPKAFPIRHTTALPSVTGRYYEYAAYL